MISFHLKHSTTRSKESDNSNLLVVAEEDLNGQPSIPTNLESILQVTNGLNLSIRQLPTIKLEVSLNSLSRHRLGDDTSIPLKTPHEHDLLRSLALLLGQLQERLVLVQRRIRGSEAGICGAVNTFALVEFDEFGRWVIWVEFDLVDGGHNLGVWVG